MLVKWLPSVNVKTYLIVLAGHMSSCMKRPSVVDTRWQTLIID